MAFKHFVSFSRSYRMFIERQFRNKACQFKEASEIKQSVSENIRDDPIKYSTSKAGEWKAIYSTSGESYFSTPRIQPLVVVMSLSAFMIYFCILREENDLDDWLRQLENDIPIQVEEAQLRIEIKSGKQKGYDMTFKEARLQEILAQKTKM